jgi:hypothetical protein
MSYIFNIGTWVPYETGVDLAERYHVIELLQPIIEFQPTSKVHKCKIKGLNCFV